MSPEPAVCHDRASQVSISGYCVGRVQVDGVGVLEVVSMWGPQVWVCFRVTGSLLRCPPKSEENSWSCLLIWLRKLRHSGVHMKVTAEGRRVPRISPMVWYLSPPV